jgi:peptidyl-prolyl cis-trans isomerase C
MQRLAFTASSARLPTGPRTAHRTALRGGTERASERARRRIAAGFVLGLVGVAALSGCPQEGGGAATAGRGASAPAGEPIAKVAGTTITVEQIQKRIDEQSPFVRVRYTDPEKKREFLDSQVRFEVLAAEAFARGMDKDPEVLEATKKIIVQKLTREEFDGRVKLQDVTDADLQKYFDEHQADYQKPEMVRASDIAIEFGKDKAKAKKIAEEVQKKAADKGKIDDRNWFKELAAEHSTDETTKRAGGDLRYVTAAEADEKLGAAARAWLFASDTINEVSPVLEGKDAFHVLKRTGKRKEITRSFDQVKNQIKNVVYREKRTAAFNAFVEELKNKHGVTVHEDKLEKVRVNAQLPPPGAMGPGGFDDGHGHGADPHGALRQADQAHGREGDEGDEPAPSPGTMPPG